MPWVRRRRPPAELGPDGAGVEGAPPAPRTSDPAPDDAPVSPSRLRRERRALARRRETEIRDVGGLALEMVRRDRFRPELLHSRAHDVLAIEQRLYELDSLLFTHVTARRELRSALPCRCGAPLIPGAHFCAHCGRPAPGTPPVVTCTHCGQPVPAEANFCSFCGNSVADSDYAVETGEIERTLVRPPEASGDGS